MTPRHLLLSALAAFIVCSPGSAAPPEGKPVLVPLFKRTTIGLPPEDDVYADEHKPVIAWLSTLYREVIAESRKSNRPLVPPAVPVVSEGRVIFVNDESVASLTLAEIKDLEPPPVASGGTVWGCDFDSWRDLTDRTARQEMHKWLEKLGSTRVDMIANRTLRGAFSANGQIVQFVDDIPIIPDSETSKFIARWSGDPEARANLPSSYEHVLGNELLVAEQKWGKLLSIIPQDPSRRATSKPFGGNVFLGSRLQVTGLTFLIHEKAKRLRITCLSWDTFEKTVIAEKKPTEARDPLRAANEIFIWDVELAAAPEAVWSDPHRRIHAIHLVQTGDLILCPTHLGRVVAVEAKTGKIKWTHEYAPLDAKRFPTFAPEWVVVPPVVVGDRYIYAPADFPELLCLNVADGKKVWSVKKGDGLYPAVVGEQVLVVGEKTLRSLSLKDGSKQWKLDLPGLPCGRGAMLGDKYLVPVSEPKASRAMIALVDVKAGKITEVLKPDKDEPIGNLVVHQEFLISQTLTEIAVFPIRK
jgi:PQQ-like domain